MCRRRRAAAAGAASIRRRGEAASADANRLLKRRWAEAGETNGAGEVSRRVRRGVEFESNLRKKRGRAAGDEIGIGHRSFEELTRKSCDGIDNVTAVVGGLTARPVLIAKRDSVCLRRNGRGLRDNTAGRRSEAAARLYASGVDAKRRGEELTSGDGARLSRSRCNRRPKRSDARPDVVHHRRRAANVADSCLIVRDPRIPLQAEAQREHYEHRGAVGTAAVDAGDADV